MQIAVAIRLVDRKSENPILKEPWCEKADPPIMPKEITEVLGQLTPEEFRDLQGRTILRNDLVNGFHNHLRNRCRGTRSGYCSNVQKHGSVSRKRAAKAVIYPQKLCRAILRGIIRQHQQK